MVTKKVDVLSKAEDPKKKNHKHITSKKKDIQDFSKKATLDKWTEDFWDKAFASERKHGDRYDSYPPRMGEAGKYSRSRKQKKPKVSKKTIKLPMTPEERHAKNGDKRTKMGYSSTGVKISHKKSRNKSEDVGNEYMKKRAFEKSILYTPMGGQNKR